MQVVSVDIREAPCSGITMETGQYPPAAGNAMGMRRTCVRVARDAETCPPSQHDAGEYREGNNIHTRIRCDIIGSAVPQFHAQISRDTPKNQARENLPFLRSWFLLGLLMSSRGTGQRAQNLLSTNAHAAASTAALYPVQSCARRRTQRGY